MSDPEQEYFADGMVEDITTALSRTGWLFVIVRNSSFTYKGRAVNIKQVGRELGVRYLLEGSVRRAGGRVRITGQLIEAATGGHVWADRFEAHSTMFSSCRTALPIALSAPSNRAFGAPKPCVLGRSPPITSMPMIYISAVLIKFMLRRMSPWMRRSASCAMQ
ncbi:MAG: hypothetical protein WAK54_33180 [Bradyrhizobium sp.]